MILTQTEDHVRIEADEADDLNFSDEAPKVLQLTDAGWLALRHLTPEARALKELVVALEGYDESTRDAIRQTIACSAELVSAVQEARVLARRMGVTTSG